MDVPVEFQDKGHHFRTVIDKFRIGKSNTGTRGNRGYKIGQFPGITGQVRS